MIIAYGVAMLGGIHAGLVGASWNTYIWSITIIMGVVFGARMYFKRKDKTNWDISDRKKRIVPMAILLVCVGVIYAWLRAFAEPSVASLFGIFFLWVIGFFLLTLKIKASGHVGMLTWLVCQLIFWFGTSMIPLVVFIPLLAWSRLALKRHTMIEVVVGFVYSILMFFVSARIIG